MSEKHQEIGAILKEERERQGYNLKEIADIIKIRVEYLQAIENGEMSKDLALPYQYGYLNIYAKSLGLNGQEFVDMYKADIELSYQGNNDYPTPEVTNYRIAPTMPVVYFAMLLSIILVILWKTSIEQDVMGEFSRDLYKAITAGPSGEYLVGNNSAGTHYEANMMELGNFVILSEEDNNIKIYDKLGAMVNEISLKANDTYFVNQAIGYIEASKPHNIFIYYNHPSYTMQPASDIRISALE